MEIRAQMEVALQQFISNNSLTEESLSLTAIEAQPLTITFSTQPQLHDYNKTNSNILRRDVKSATPAVGLTSDSTFRYVTWGFLSRLTFQAPEAGSWQCSFIATLRCSEISGDTYPINIGLHLDGSNYISHAHIFTRLGETAILTVSKLLTLKSGSMVLPTYTNKGEPGGRCVARDYFRSTVFH